MPMAIISTLLCLRNRYLRQIQNDRKMWAFESQLPHITNTQPLPNSHQRRSKAYPIINPQQRSSRLKGRFETLNLTNHRFHHSRLDIISHFSLVQIKSVVLQASLRISSRCRLRSIVVSSELCDKFCWIFGGVYCQGLGNDEKSIGEFCYRELLSRALEKDE